MKLYPPLLWGFFSFITAGAGASGIGMDQSLLIGFIFGILVGIGVAYAQQEEYGPLWVIDPTRPQRLVGIAILLTPVLFLFIGSNLGVLIYLPPLFPIILAPAFDGIPRLLMTALTGPIAGLWTMWLARIIDRWLDQREGRLSWR